MQSQNIFVTEPDMDQLSQMIELAKKSVGKDREPLTMLEGELDRAHIVSPYRVPGDVVTMHSRVRVRDLNADKDSNYTLVFPRDADFTQGKISVLAPVGTAILGCRAGDVIEWKVPGGSRRLRIEEVLYQPERAGRVGMMMLGEQIEENKTGQDVRQFSQHPGSRPHLFEVA